MPVAVFRLALALAVVGIAAVPAHAQDQLEGFLGQAVAEVRIELEGTVSSSPGLRQLVTVAVGQPLRLQDLRTTQNALAALGTFDDTRMEVLAEKEAAGVVITFRLWNRHPVDRVEVTGNTGLDPTALRDLILDQFGRVLPSSLTQDRMRVTVERVLRDEGFLHATVKTVDLIQTHDRHRATMQVTVDAGPRAIITKTDVVGQSSFSPAEVIDRTGTAPGQPFREREIRDRLAQIRDDLGRQGHYSAQARIDARRESAGGAGIEITLAVNAGQIVEVAWDRTADPPPSGGLDEHVPVRQEGSVDQDLLDQGEANLEAALQREGYFKADVTHSRSTRGNILTITYRIVRGRRHYVEGVQLPGDLKLPRALVEKLLNIRRGDVLDVRRVTDGLVRVVAEYQQRGYYLADGDPQYEELPARETPTQTWVILHPRFIEGPLGTVEGIEFAFTGAATIPEAELRAVMRSRPGQPYLELNRRADEDALRSLYDARGYRDARVEIIGPDEKTGSEKVMLKVTVTEGLASVVGDVLVFGNTIDEQSILEDLALKPGDPFSERARLDSERRLYDRGVFRRVRVLPEPALPGETRVRVIVTVEELPSTNFAYGGGVEVGTITRTAADLTQDDDYFVAPRGLFQVTRRNIGGRNRSLSFYSRLSLKPEESAGGRRFGFSEYRIAPTFTELRAFRTQTDLLLGISSEQAVRTGYKFVRHGASADALRRLTPSVAVTARYGLDFTRLFDVNPVVAGPVDRFFPLVRLSTVSTGVIWDGRDNPLAATRGSLITVDFETAARALGSEVGYVKVFAQASRFHALDEGQLVVAARLQTGVARGFTREVERVDQSGNPVTDRIADLPASQRFFAGGSTTVRGFQLDRLGVQEIIDPVNGLSRGGNGVVVMNIELRRVVARLGGRPLAAVAFFDAGNVFAKASDVDFTRLRGTPGFGVRFDSPLGPIRFDMGFKLSRRFVGIERERGFEFHLSIGEAF